MTEPVNRLPAQEFEKHMLVTVHGVLSDNDKLSEVRRRCKDRLPGLQAYSVNYTRVSPLMLVLFRGTRELIVGAVRDQLKAVAQCQREEGLTVHVVAHSYGSLMLVGALAVSAPALRIDSMILAGSIVPRRHPWDELIHRNLLSRPPVAMVRPLDWVVPFAPLVAGEASGSRGFSVMGRHVPTEAWRVGGHTDYCPADVDHIVDHIRSSVVPGGPGSLQEWKADVGRCARLQLLLKRLVLLGQG